MNKMTDWLKWLGVAIAASPGLGYALAYCYERGYCDFFKIPADLIQIGWPTIFMAILTALAGLLLVSWLLMTLVMSNLKNMGLNRQKFYFAFIYLLFFLCVATIYLTVEEAKVAGAIYLILLIFIFVAPTLIRRYRRGKGLTVETKETEHKDPMTRVLENQTARYILVVLLILFIVYASAYYGSRSSAMRQQIFYIPSSNQESVVLRICGENLICAPIYYRGKDERGQDFCIIKQEFFILKVDQPNLSIEANQLGYVRVKELP